MRYVNIRGILAMGKGIYWTSISRVFGVSNMGSLGLMTSGQLSWGQYSLFDKQK